MPYPGRMPEDPFGDWKDSALDCPSNARNACINGNRGYTSVDEAWAACKDLAECGVVAEIDGGLYLRRAGDPNRAGGRQMAYPGRGPEDPFGDWQASALDCPSNARNACINGNRGYNSLDEAWAACKALAECGVVSEIGLVSTTCAV